MDLPKHVQRTIDRDRPSESLEVMRWTDAVMADAAESAVKEYGPAEAKRRFCDLVNRMEIQRCG